jgi:DNA polymerase-3 subunit delta'
MASGHPDRLREELREARRQERVNGAYLFEGPPGTGKEETAFWFARLLLCRQSHRDPCGSCPDCRKDVTHDADGRRVSQHPDLKVLEPDGPHIRVDQIRALQRDLSLVANEGGWRVALILEADTLRTEAANALLKTLEEPPPRTAILLVVSVALALPRTVRSRTIHLRFAPEPESSIQAALLSAGFNEADAWLAATVGGGSTARATEWAAQHLETAREMRETIESIRDAPISEALDFAETFRGSSAATRQRAEILLAVCGAVARRGLERASREGGRTGLDRWLGFAESTQRARQEMIRRNLNPQLLVEGLLLDLQET